MDHLKVTIFRYFLEQNSMIPLYLYESLPCDTTLIHSPKPLTIKTRLQNTQFNSNENTNMMQHCAGFISAGSLYMFRAHAPIIRSI